MKISVNISKEKMNEILEKTKQLGLASYNFEITVDDDAYRADLICKCLDLIKGLDVDYRHKVTIEINIFDFKDINLISELQKKGNIIKIGESEFYISDIEKWITGDNKITFLLKDAITVD